MVSSTIKPLSLEDLAKVPGVLGEISAERYHDYLDAELSQLKNVPERPGVAEALRQEGLSIIAEVKRSSPSQGAIADLDPLQAAKDYEAGGASALSILTEERHFGGKLEYISQVAAEVNLPILRKDFTVHPQQIIEAREMGASAALLIVAVLGQKTAAYIDFVHSVGLDALVEVHDEAELDIALDSNARTIGVNNRNLQDLSIDLQNAPRLIERAKNRGFTGLLIAESGYKTAKELQDIKAIADAVLVGTSIAGSGDLKAAVRNLKL